MVKYKCEIGTPTQRGWADGLVKALVGARSDCEGSFSALVFNLVPGQVVTGVLFNQCRPAPAAAAARGSAGIARGSAGIARGSV